jgi:predicted nucleic acid-binding Zn finger protein
MTPPRTFVRETKNYWVLAEVPSDSSDQVYEIRTSKNDEKTYCTCKGWIFKARKGDGICKHIRRFKQEQPEQEVVVYKLDEFLAVKRTLVLDDDAGSVRKTVKTKRARPGQGG